MIEQSDSALDLDVNKKMTSVEKPGSALNAHDPLFGLGVIFGCSMEEAPARDIGQYSAIFHRGYNSAGRAAADDVIE